jgi:hypothetical protein
VEDPLSSDNLTDVPTVAEYRRIFPICVRASRGQQKRDGLSPIMEMLRANYEAPEHTATAGQLAKKVNLTNFGDANLRYGTFAKLLCEQLGRKPNFYIAILVTFRGGQWDNGIVRWTMLPQVAAALEELGWVKRR